MSDIIDDLIAHAAERGFGVRVAAAGHLEALRAEMAARLASGELDRTFAGERLAHFEFAPSLDGRPVRSLIVTAAFQPQQMTVFRYRGLDHEYPVPPTYADGTDHAVAAALADVLAPRGYQAVRARLPYKLLAARTGLTRYGRNNLAYHPAFGSYFRLMTFISDLPATADHWGEPAWLPEYADCTACATACPTGAVTTERAVIRAERCLTYFNEGPADFPAWVKPGWFRCLVGCLFCQLACPVDRGIDIRPGEPFRFSEAETGNLLAARETGDLLPGVREKLAALELLEDWQIIARNLRVLLGAA